MIRSVGSALAATLLLMILSVSPVAAHAELEESDPADGETIETPYTLTATYSEELDADASRIVVRAGGRGGPEVARGSVSESEATVMEVELPALEPGEYLALWTAVTPDDQGVTRGQIAFTVAASATPSPTSTPSPRATPSPTGSSPTALSTATATAAPTPAPSPSPVASPPPSDGQPASSNDALLALILAGVAIGVIAAFLFARSRR